jgi:hypothetical protein
MGGMLGMFDILLKRSIIPINGFTLGRQCARCPCQELFEMEG